MEKKTAEEIFNSHSWHALGHISGAKHFCIPAMEEYASQLKSALSEREGLIRELANALERVMQDGKGVARDQFGERMNLDKWASFVDAKNLLQKAKPFTTPELEGDKV